MRNYWDHLGRLHSKPVTATNPYPCNNSYVYTAYYKVLKNITTPKKVLNHVSLLSLEHPISRHPEKFEQPLISHDELHGVSILSSVFGARFICEYLRDNHNQYCDLPDFKPKPFYKLNWIKVIPALYAVYKSPEPRHEVLKHPAMHPLAFWQQPQYRWFYKRAAGITPSLWEKLIFTVLRFVSIMNWKKDDPNLLLFFSIEFLYKKNNLGLEGTFIERLLRRKVTSHYKSIEDMMRHKTRDFPTEYQEDHPFFIKE